MGDGHDKVAEAVLVIGDAPAPAHAVRIAFTDLDAGALARVAPVFVICRLFAAGGDALAVGEMLAALRWRGQLLVIAPDLPNPAMVQREIQSGAAGVAVEIVPELQA